ncbi:unnamed protein product [Timema podura]|uniref:EF-hand domain-containing protein n=1 Tax=Timema podura TaxID=61482 RepID=A0ABN7PMC7_TIMPD|nr:unnamed protein product [Timema podura]
MVPTFVNMVSTANPPTINLSFLDLKQLLLYSSSSSFVPTGMSLTPFQTHCFTGKFWKCQGSNPRQFIQGVSQFSVKGDKESKLRFAFRIYDMDNDGYISNGELFQVLKMMVGNNLKDTQLQQIVDKTILFADRDEDGKINFEEFCSVVGNTDIHKKMVVDV